MTAAHALARHAGSPHGEPRVRFRAAGPDDAAACAPLVFASGVGEFGYFLGEPETRCIAFLTDAFRSRHGRFSWRRHRVGVAEDGTVLAVMAVQDGSRTMLDDVHVVWALLRYFGVRGTLGRLLRGLVLETELPAPKRAQILVAHCATAGGHRGRGIFSALLDDAMRVGLLPSDGSRDVVLDVLVSNGRAKALYERLGFVALVRSRNPSRRLPAGLESIRMRLERRA
ncbi:GNAT family N-acetyltransferase [Burkholderia sp. MR1-5-21]